MCFGVDVGKSEHHAVALDRSGKRLFDKAMPNDGGRLRALIFGLKEHGQLLLVVDQPATIGALPITVARAEGILVAYLPGLAMRRIAHCTLAKRRRTQEMPRSLPKLLALCHMRCARFAWMTNSWLNLPCCAGLTMIWQIKSPRQATEFAGS
jgi:hypothetical protein